MLDPRSSSPNIDYVGLSPRLDTLDGKKIGVINHGGGNEPICHTIAPKLQELHPEAEFVTYELVGSRTFSRMDPVDLAFLESCDAIISCHAY